MTRARRTSGQRRIAWLASYPRSGNSWVNVLLANFLSASTEPVGINEIPEEFPVVGVCQRRWHDSVTGISSSNCTDDETESLRPAVCRALAREAKPGKTLLFCNTHEACRATPFDEPLFPDDVTVGAVYVVRHPLDVVVSWAFYFGDEDFSDSIASLNSRKNRLGGAGTPELRQRLLDWSGHVESWSGAPFPVLWIRYEDLLADTTGWLGRIALFLRLDGASDPRRLERAVAHSGFCAVAGERGPRRLRETKPAQPGLLLSLGCRRRLAAASLGGAGARRPGRPWTDDGPLRLFLLKHGAEIMEISSKSRVRCCLSDKFVNAVLDDDQVFMDVAEGEFYGLRETGRRTWQLIEGGRRDRQAG